MKKNGILNSHISKVLADLGHTDYIVIADLGLPVPAGVPKIDLALTYGVPGFEQVVEIVAADMEIEKVTIAEEMVAQNESAYAFTVDTFRKAEIESCSHKEFKKRTSGAKVVIRTGEAKPYANCILQAGVWFGTQE
ncbi:D-ribose pyranase [Saccharibacillus endophyticus]|uniref:D-ribose pyranase n=1 Tax=Saccharibacillus endophyticus TaxID=2060666 RepID=A0ABQ1ZXT3_9BACL|nr:D-ribose pyranase [Saccharibacillus endophyticus]GGH80332.1 D-ribose pyranase [Saccharibacillus endophyticus]